MKQKNVKTRKFLYTISNICRLNKLDKCSYCYLCRVEGHLAHRCLARNKGEQQFRSIVSQYLGQKNFVIL